MRRPMFVLVLGVAVVAALGPASLARVEANRVVFRDSTGEDPAGPDVTSVTVSNGDGGVVTFRVAIPNRPTLTEDMRFRVWLDTDRDRATGLTRPGEAPTGFDYFLLWERGEASLFRCAGNTCTGGGAADPPQRTLRSSYGGGPVFTIAAAELGETKGFRFAVEVADVANARWDYAPAQGETWRYDVRLGPSRLLVKRFSTTPAAPRAGRDFAVRLTAARDDTGAALTKGRVRCAATVGGRAVPVRVQRFGFCVFAVPPGMAGKTIRGSIAIVSEGLRVTKSFERRIR